MIDNLFFNVIIQIHHVLEYAIQGGLCIASFNQFVPCAKCTSLIRYSIFKTIHLIFDVNIVNISHVYAVTERDSELHLGLYTIF